MKTWMIAVPFAFFFALLGYAAVAAPNGVVRMGGFWNDKKRGTVELYRFQDKGPDAVVDCYVAHAVPPDVRLEMQCFRTELRR